MTGSVLGLKRLLSLLTISDLLLEGNEGIKQSDHLRRDPHHQSLRRGRRVLPVVG